MVHIKNNIILEMKSITKCFPGVKALDNVDFNLFEGEVHSIVGANGAGKSTLINILGGVYTDYTGSIKIYNREEKIINPKKSIKLGISLISQQFNLINEFSIAENIFLHNEPSKFGILNHHQLNVICNQWLEKFNLELKPNTKVSELNVIEKQMIEILKALVNPSSTVVGEKIGG